MRTKGPWEAHFMRGAWDIGNYHTGGPLIARVSNDANARAIAQVPAMVEICRKLNAYTETHLAAGEAIPYPGLVEQARAILRAIEGE